MIHVLPQTKANKLSCTYPSWGDERERALWMFPSSVPLWWGGVGLHETKALETVASGLEAWKETVTSEHGKRETCRCTDDTLQYRPRAILELGGETWDGRCWAPVYSLHLNLTQHERREWGNSQCILCCYVFSGCALYRYLDYTEYPKTCQVTEKKKHYKKPLKMIYEVSGFHKATSDKYLKYLVWLLTEDSSVQTPSYFKFYLLKYTWRWPSSSSCPLSFFLCVLSCNFVIRSDLDVIFP